MRSLYRPGAIYQVTKELCRYNNGIAALQEVRWPGQGECSLDNKVTLFYSGSDTSKHINGTGFIVDGNIVGNILRFDAVLDRLCSIRIAGKFSNITIINAYAPTEQGSEESKDKFYEDLECLYDQIPEYDTKILVGDFNAKIGREDVFLSIIGKHSKHEKTLEDGLRLITFATAKSMVVKSTIFSFKTIYKGTWKSPDGRTINQIDHVLIDN